MQNAFCPSPRVPRVSTVQTLFKSLNSKSLLRHKGMSSCEPVKSNIPWHKVNIPIPEGSHGRKAKRKKARLKSTRANNKSCICMSGTRGLVDMCELQQIWQALP
jgi:hypothetical protein